MARKIVERICAQCSRPYGSRKKEQIYCGNACAVAARTSGGEREDPNVEMSLKEIADELGCCWQNVQRILKSALRKVGRDRMLKEMANG